MSKFKMSSKEKNKKTVVDQYAKREAAKYDNPIASREFILNIFHKRPRGLTALQLASILNLDDDFKKEALRRRLLAMLRDNQLAKLKKGKFILIKPVMLITGRVIGHPDGFGFVAPQDNSSHVFVSGRQMRQVFDGDIVNVRVINVASDNKREGIIADILERKRNFITGQFIKQKNINFIKPDNKRITQDIIIPAEYTKDAHNGQLVVAKISEYPTMQAHAIGKITEVLGNYMAPGLEIDVAVRSYDLPYKWTKEINKELVKIDSQIDASKEHKRVDLRELPFVTIDGENAKDFDDAVYCEKTESGSYNLYVAIADVAHYVKEHSALDKEAKERGNSVYFPGEVIPMLPEKLSNDLCSLKPKVDRLVIVCQIKISKTGDIVNYKFYSAIIHSAARLTYTIVADYLENDNAPKNLALHLKNLHVLYKARVKKRGTTGILDFDSDDIQVEFDDKRKIKRLFLVKRNDAHRIIEESMLCANICAAKFLQKHNALALYRVHDGPKIDGIKQVREFLAELGLELTGGDMPTSKDYADLLEKAALREDKHIIQTLLLRSMSQAFYSPSNDGHFGLAFAEYAHFTSPIRRYPDLIVHRAIYNVLINKAKENYSVEEVSAMQSLAEHCSMTERRADEATRETLKWLKCEYMLAKVGMQFSGIISSVVGFGLFVELSECYIEGLIHITSLSDDYYTFDAARHTLTGRSKKRTYRLGDAVEITVAKVDLSSRRIDFALV